MERGRGDRDIVVTIGNPLELAIADAALLTAVPGDPNRNGTFGADDLSLAPARTIVRGDRESSYLWRRLLGTVPGSRMPLANGELTNVQLIALGCWIETIGTDADPLAPIDYASCSFYESPPLLTTPAE